MSKLGSPQKERVATLPPPVKGCRWIPLTRGKFALVDIADYEKLSQFCWVFHWQGYAFRKAPTDNPSHLRMHREILGVTDRNILVDHRDGDGLNNRRDNLRAATRTENNRNNVGRSHRQSPFKGVSPSGRPKLPWSARITVNKKTVNLGRFVTAEEAAAAYDKAASHYFGHFAKTNVEIIRLRTSKASSVELS